MKKAFVTGARGFLGANLIKRLKNLGISYVRWDAIDGNYLDSPNLALGMSECDFVFHLAANADIQSGWNNPTKDLMVNTVGTSLVLEAMRKNGIRRIGFASSSAVYGETLNPAEDCPWPVQTSLYGASKVAGEALCQAYSEGQGFEAYLFRFVPLLGEGYRHGHIFDFVKQLLVHPACLTVRGDGRQRKGYVYVEDAIDAMMLLANNRLCGAYNICSGESATINESIKWITEAMDVSPEITYTGGNKGWVGDAPKLTPDPTKLRSLAWGPTITVEQAVKKTVGWMLENREIFK